VAPAKSCSNGEVPLIFNTYIWSFTVYLLQSESEIWKVWTISRTWSFLIEMTFSEMRMSLEPCQRWNLLFVKVFLSHLSLICRQSLILIFKSRVELL
jgi:hypothetical protein